MYNVSNGTLKVGQVEQYKACAIFRIWGGGGGGEQAGDFHFCRDFSGYRHPIF